MKKGMARRANPVVLEYIRAGTISKRSACPSTTKKITDVKPMETAMGSPNNIRKTRTEKIRAVIMAFYFPFAAEEERVLISLTSPFSRGRQGEWTFQ
jgi:hypothetical protein